MATAAVIDTTKPVLYISPSLIGDSELLRKTLFDLKSIDKALDAVEARDGRSDALDEPLESARTALAATKDALIEAYAIAATEEAYGEDFDAALLAA